MNGLCGKIRWALVLLAAASALMAACSSGGKTNTAASPTPPQFIEDLPPRGKIQAMAGDKITVELSVYHAKYLILDSDNPAEVYPGAGTPFDFDKKVYKIDAATKSFPLKITFAVAGDARPGPHDVMFGMRLFYKNKSDNSSLAKNTTFTVPVEVVTKNVEQTKTHRYPMEYMLE